MHRSAHDAFRAARDHLLEARLDYERARREFRWPELPEFNWALDWFDVVARGEARDRIAVRVVHDEGPDEQASYEELAARSSRLAAALAARGVRRGDRVLVMLPNALALWDVVLAVMKLGAVLVPASMQLTPEDLQDRVERGGIRHAVVAAEVAPRLADLSIPGVKLVAGGEAEGFEGLDAARLSGGAWSATEATRSSDPLLLYFTSGTTARPKLVLHSHRSYPLGHLTTMYWVGLQPGDVHQNISSPGWAKHAWSSLFAPLSAEATVLVHDTRRFRASRQLELLRDERVATLCAPPTVWRLLILEDLGARPPQLRDAVSAGEPLNPEIIATVEQAWGLTLRDGFGQTETTLQVGNSPGQPVKPGSMGRPMPGYEVVLLDHEGREASAGEVALRLDPRPAGLFDGYHGDEARTAQALGGGYYRTGDEATRDEDGYLHYVGRGDDVFKSSDYRLSPFELESALLEHPDVAEAAVVPSPDAVRLSVPKAFVVLRPGVGPSPDVARSIFAFLRDRLAPYKRVKILEFSELPKTISGKIRRVELRAREQAQRAAGGRAPLEFFADDQPR
jgi:acetyl-CoA synthetase